MEIALHAKLAGYEVSVATFIDSRDDEEKILGEGLNLYHIDIGRGGSGFFYDLRSCVQLFQLYGQIKPDIIHHVAMKPLIFGGIIARLRGCKGVVQAVPGLGYSFVSKGAVASVKRVLILMALRLACGGQYTKVIVQNAENKSLLLEERVIRADQVILIRGSGVDVSLVECQPEQKSKPRVVLAARMLREKGIAEFVSAARLLREEGLEVEFFLAGQPDLSNPGSLSLEELESWHESGVVQYLGFVEDIEALFAACHIVCLPTYYGEGVPKVLIEAAACERPVVTTDQPGCRDIVRAGVNGELVPPKDVKGLTDALRMLILDPDKRKEYGVAGRRLVSSEFDLSIVIEQTLAVYSEFLTSENSTRFG